MTALEKLAALASEKWSVDIERLQLQAVDYGAFEYMVTVWNWAEMQQIASATAMTLEDAINEVWEHCQEWTE